MGVQFGKKLLTSDLVYRNRIFPQSPRTLELSTCANAYVNIFFASSFEAYQRGNGA